MLNAADYRRVFKRAWRSADNCFTVLARVNDGLPARLGLAVAKKNLKRAVDRNRLKRLIREGFRQHQELLSGLDIIVMVRPNIARMSNENLSAALLSHWLKLAAKRDRISTND